MYTEISIYIDIRLRRAPTKVEHLFSFFVYVSLRSYNSHHNSRAQSGEKNESAWAEEANNMLIAAFYL